MRQLHTSETYRAEYLRRPRIPVPCKVCGTEFMAVVSAVRGGRGTVCSHSCKAKLASRNRNQLGSRNPNWKGGKSICRSPEELRAYRTEKTRKYRQRYPERYQAHRIMRNALRRGDLERTCCEVCGEARTEGHHEDYSKPLQIIWLCRKHHEEADKRRIN